MPNDPAGAPASRAVGMRSVLHEGNPGVATELRHRFGFRGDESADVNEDHRRGPRVDGRADGGGRQGQRLALDVDESRDATGMHHRRRSGEERIGRHDDLAPFDAEDAEDDLQGARAAAHGDGERRRVTGAEGGLETLGVRPERQRPARQCLVDQGQRLGPIFGCEHDAGGRDGGVRAIVHAPMPRRPATIIIRGRLGADGCRRQSRIGLAQSPASVMASTQP